MASNAASIYNYLTGNGFSPSAASGILGNLAQESSLNPGESGGGLAQWQGDRYAGLTNYAKSQGLDPNGLQAQEGYLVKEIKTGNWVDPNVLNSLSPAQAALYFSNNFERPRADVANNTGRQQYANEYYSQFTGNAAPTAPQGSTTTGGTLSGIAGPPSIWNPGSIIRFGFWSVLGLVLIGLGVWVLLNPFSDITNAVRSLAGRTAKASLDGTANRINNLGRKAVGSRTPTGKGRRRFLTTNQILDLYKEG